MMKVCLPGIGIPKLKCKDAPQCLSLVLPLSRMGVWAPFRLSVKYVRPVFIRFFYVGGHIFHPAILNLLVIVQIKLAFDNRPCLRVDVRRGTTADGIGSVTTILGHIFLRCGFK